MSLLHRARALLAAIRIRALRARYGWDYGALVHERLRFTLREAVNRWLIGSYRLREGGATVLLRHHPSPHGTPSNDTWTLREIFRDQPYALPAGVELPSRPRIVDLGANLGLFIAFILARFPEATVTAFEPDPDSVRLLREGLSRSSRAEQVSVHAACAMVADGPVKFSGGGHQFSRVTHAGEPAGLVVPGVDIFPFLRGADLLKMDIEGAEWALLSDRRFGAARVVVLEYHPMLCPGPDPRALVRELLSQRGYRIVVDEPPMIWAVRDIEASATGESGAGS